ncbi:ret finger protein-like 4B [Peromyscus californicus insignis]|uniref:ret finger protein-like 4B n=1 Tax=Peromyscus californicus insignis TaxID=564181 RepID=UPI0022A6B013|nr:ret finger protein-like 4B [Peromyscus californicus insignis]
MAVLPEKWTPDGSLEVEAVCPICLDFYSYPVSLSCAHVFCFDCTKNWMAQGAEDSILSCPLCREENKRPIMYEWMIRELIILIKQHGPLLKQPMGQITGPQGFCSVDTALEIETGDSSLVLSNGLSDVCCGEPGHNSEDPRRFTPLAGVLDSSNVSLVCPEVDVGKRKEWTSGVCKEPVSRRNLAITWWKILGESPNWPESWTAPTSPSSGICKLTQEREMQRILSESPLWTLQAHSFVLNSQGKGDLILFLLGREGDAWEDRDLNQNLYRFGGGNQFSIIRGQQFIRMVSFGLED